eukprot:gene9202-biopygen4252
MCPSPCTAGDALFGGGLGSEPPPAMLYQVARAI